MSNWPAARPTTKESIKRQSHTLIHATGESWPPKFNRERYKAVQPQTVKPT